MSSEPPKARSPAVVTPFGREQPTRALPPVFTKKESAKSVPPRISYVLFIGAVTDTSPAVSEPSTSTRLVTFLAPRGKAVLSRIAESPLAKAIGSPPAVHAPPSLQRCCEPFQVSGPDIVSRAFTDLVDSSTKISADDAAFRPTIVNFDAGGRSPSRKVASVTSVLPFHCDGLAYTTNLALSTSGEVLNVIPGLMCSVSFEPSTSVSATTPGTNTPSTSADVALP